MTATFPDAISVQQQPNPRRRTVLRGDTVIGSVEQVSDGILALIAGIPAGTYRTPAEAIARVAIG